ncbi:zinc finger protein family member [Novymonas esmeraldas]|uniref:Zinc finger protein family member n=1 Tax=Novymonas esmeraldas TaxID=1808958 RepID=A0AAW0F971_9TRYP
MYGAQEMMYSVFGTSANGGSNPHVYSAYPHTNPYNPGFGNGGGGGGGGSGGAGGGGMVYDYTGGAAAHGHGNGRNYGLHSDPSMGSTYEFNTGMPMHGANGAGFRGGYGSRGGGGVGAGGVSRRGRGGDGAGPRNQNGYDQQVATDYEVHDNQLKAPVVVTPATVVPNLGSARLFSKPPKAIVYGSRSVVRICDAFQESRCVAGDRCHDIHVRPEYLAETRMEMSSWLLDREREFRQTLETDPEKTFRIFVADLKEVVEVPIGSLVFSKGLYVDPTTRAKRARGVGNHAHVHAVMQVPTSCGLYSADPLQCKWERWCNQVHIDRRWMQSKKSEFDQWFNELQNRYFSLAPDDTFTVHDPQLKSSVVLPKFSIAGFSRGLFQGSMKKLASVCLLFQRGKCTAGSCCNQIHVCPQYLSLARELTAIEQSPDASTEEKQRIVAQMELLRGPLIDQQLKERQEAEQAAALEAASHSNVVSVENDENHHENHGGALEAKTGAEDDLCSSGALFEHVQVDEDAEPASHPVSANTSLTRRLNTSAPDINPFSARHVNSDGSYSFNPYGSVTSLPEGSSSYNRLPGARAGAPQIDGSSGGNGGVHFTPGSVQLLSTGSKGMRRLVAVVSPDSGNGMSEGPRNAEDMGASGTAGSQEKGPHFATAPQRGSGGYHRTVLLQRGIDASRYDGGMHGEQSSSLHPLDFDASLHFSPTPLLGFDASTTSMYRNGSIRDEDPAMHPHLRLAASNSSYLYPGSSTASQQYLLSTPMQRGMTGNTAAVAKARLAASATSSRLYMQRTATSLPDGPVPYAGMGGSATSIPAMRPTPTSDQASFTR